MTNSIGQRLAGMSLGHSTLMQRSSSQPGSPSFALTQISVGPESPQRKVVCVANRSSKTPVVELSSVRMGTGKSSGSIASTRIVLVV